MFKTRYRVSRDWVYTFMFSVQVWRWWWPFWSEYVGMLPSEAEARKVIEMLHQEYTP